MDGKATRSKALAVLKELADERKDCALLDIWAALHVSEIESLSDIGKWEQKVWGRVRHIFGESSSVSLLTGLIPKTTCSIHYHEYRYNKFISVSAVIDVVVFAGTYEVVRHRLTSGMELIIPPKTIHSFEVVESGDVVEVYWCDDGSKPEHADIHRLVEGGEL